MMPKAKALSLLNGLTRLARPCNRIQNTLYTIIQYICLFQTTKFPDTNANTSEIPDLSGLGRFGSIMVGDIFNFAKHFAQFPRARRSPHQSFNLGQTRLLSTIRDKPQSF